MVESAAVVRLAEQLIAEHLPSGDWSFAFDSAKRRAGACDYSRRRITVSRYLAAKTDEADLRQVLLHEIAHALAGHAAAHGPRWRSVAQGLGYTGERLHHGPIADERAPWVGTCVAGHVHYRFRRPASPLSCGLCARGFSRAALITWQRREQAARSAVPSTTAQSTTATSFQNAT
jgi:predicted SprT family Zn-dependent metalloprotease